jgi:hypothetical protein
MMPAVHVDAYCNASRRQVDRGGQLLCELHLTVLQRSAICDKRTVLHEMTLMMITSHIHECAYIAFQQPRLS